MILSKKSVFLILISVIISGSIGIALFSYIPVLLKTLGYEAPVIQLVSTIFPLTTAVLPPIMGRISDKIQRRAPFFIIGSAGVSLVLFLLGFADNLILIAILMFIYGFMSANYMLIFIYYQEIVQNNSRFIAYYNAASVLGWFLGTLFGGIFINFYGIQILFWILFFISLSVIFIVIFIRENRQLILEAFEEVQSMGEEGNPETRPEKADISRSIYLALFFRNFGIRPIVAVLAIIMAFFISNESEIGFLLGFNFLLQFFLMILIGRIINQKNLKLILVIGYALSAVTIFGYIISIDFWGFLICQILISFSFAMFWNANQIYIAQKTTPKNKGKYVGYANSSFYLGGFLGGIFFSGLLLINSDYFIMMYSMIIFPILSTLIIMFGFKKPVR